MVHANHVIFGAYGFWLPNDPRGSWSEFVGSWELLRFGRTTRMSERRILTELEAQKLQRAKLSLKYSAVLFSDSQIEAIAEGFARLAARCRIHIWACSILPEHVHLVIARHRLAVETVSKLLKAEATKCMREQDVHPLAHFTTKKNTYPPPWARGQWKSYLNTRVDIENAVAYAEDNPDKEGRPRQDWWFVKPFPGLEPGCITYH